MVKGVFLSIAASCLFGLLYYFPVLLRPLSTIEIFCWRLLMSWPAIAILVSLEHRWNMVFAIIQRVRRQPLFLLAILFSAAMISVQMFIFVWAPLNGKALSTSLGYFILPLVMVISGRFIYKERFSLLQKMAIAMAVIGVVYEIYITGAFALETVIVAVGYPIYFIFRREMRIDGIEGTFFDFLCIAIACGIFLFTQYDIDKIATDFAHFSVIIPMLGVVTAIAFAALR